MIQLEIYKDMEKGFYSTIFPFGFAVSLQMEGSKKPTLDVEKVGKQ